jgi:transposase
MAERKEAMDIREMIRRLRMGEGIRAVSRELGIHRDTVKKYRDWAREQGLLEGPAETLPDLQTIHEKLQSLAAAAAKPSGPPPALEPYREWIAELFNKGVDMTVIYDRLRKERGYGGSYSAVRRYVKRLKLVTPEAVLRVETAPGEDAQVDFGYAGKLYDPARGLWRKAWLFVMTLGFSRHMYAEIVFDQTITTWIALHVRAFEFFGGVVKRVVLDNLKAAIVKAVVHDSEATRSYRELAEHYGFLISPCRPRMARHKGKVERMVQYVRRSALQGREFKSVDEANAHLRSWLMQVAGTRVHGTTRERPLERFDREKPHLRPLAATRYEVVIWKQAKVHPDCHVSFEYNQYSAPYRLIGRPVWLRITAERIEIYTESHERVATHVRARFPGNRVTRQEHLPAERLQAAMVNPQHVRRQAEQIGPRTLEVIERLLGERPMDRLRTAQGIVGLSRKYGPARLEAACARALSFDDTRYHTIKNVLRKGLDLEPAPDPGQAPGPLPQSSRFARPATDFLPMPTRGTSF